MINPICKYTIVLVFTIILFEIGALNAYGLAPVKNDSLRFEVLLSSKLLDDAKLEINFIRAQEMTSNRLILLSSANQFYLLGWGGIQPLGPKITESISSFAYTPDGFLLIIRNRELCYVDSIGIPNKLIGLPDNEMGIAPGKNAMYLYEQNKNKTKHALYVLEKGGSYKELFTVPSPIHSVIEMDQLILFSTENALLSFNRKNNEFKALATLPGVNEIKSVAIDSLGSTIYFSTDNSIFAVNNSSLINLTNEFGGILRFFEDGLLVYNPEKKFLIRIVGLEGKITSKIQELKNTQPEKSPDNILTNTTIIDLVKSNLSDGLIINLINRSVVDFNLSIDAMIYLSSQNVSSAVIVAMKNAMKRKAGMDSNDTKQ